MKQEILAVIKKELMKVFSDKRVLFTTIIMPGLMIFIIYSLLGNITRDKDYSNYSGVVVNKPSFFYMISNNDENWEEEDFRNINELKSRVQKKQLVDYKENNYTK